jgi:hypothetical protein
MMGVVEGGWEFVIAAYAVTALVLGGYGLSVFLRWRAARRDEARGLARTGS